MKKILLSLVTVLMTITASAQVTYSWTWEDWEGVTKIKDNTDGSANTAGSDVISFIKDGFSIEAKKNSGTSVPVVHGGVNDLRTYAKNTVTVSNNTAMTKLVFTVSTQGKKRLSDLAVTEGEVDVDAENWIVTWTGSATSVTFTVGEKATYGTDGNTKAGQFDVDNVTVYTSGSSTGKKAAGLKFNPATVTIEQGDAFTAPVFTKSTTATVTFNTTDDEVASVSADGVITLGTEVGQATITATCAANDEYEEGSATCVITVNPKTQAINVTCEEAKKIALALTANNTPTTEVYRLVGYVTDTNGNISKGQQTFWMADTKDGGNVFEGYWCNLPDANVPLAVGDKIQLTGKIMKYNTTPEIKNGDVVVLEKSTEQAQTITATAKEAFDAGSALEAGASTKEFYDVTAYVEEVTYNFSGGTQSFKLTDVKGEAGTGLVAYKVQIAEAATVGAKVRVIGKIKKYVDSKDVTTIEFDGGKADILESGETTTIGGLDTFENGGFEEWVNDSQAKGWKSTTTASSGSVSKSEDAHSGSYSICLKNASSNTRLASKEYKLGAGWYTFQAYVKSATETLTEARPGIAPWNDAENKMGSYMYGDYTEPLSQTEWTLVTYTFKLTAETQINLVVMNPKSTEATKYGDLLIDDAVLRVATEDEVTATGVNTVKVTANASAIYNLAGQRVEKMQKGINIVGGKKVVIK